jgi:hypothetical protein
MDEGGDLRLTARAAPDWAGGKPVLPGLFFRSAVNGRAARAAEPQASHLDQLSGHAHRAPARARRRHEHGSGHRDHHQRHCRPERPAPLTGGPRGWLCSRSPTPGLLPSGRWRFPAETKRRVPRDGGPDQQSAGHPPTDTARGPAGSRGDHHAAAQCEFISRKLARGTC